MWAHGGGVWGIRSNYMSGRMSDLTGGITCNVKACHVVSQGLHEGSRGVTEDQSGYFKGAKNRSIFAVAPLKI